MMELRNYTARDQAWLVDQHATLYAAQDGFDDSFGPLVDQILTQYLTDHNPNIDQGWIAASDGIRMGSIFCVAGAGGYAKLRLFLVLPDARGTGLAQMLLDRCMLFARTQGYSGIRLWTHQSHVAACRLYAKNQFSCIASASVENFGQNLVEQTWEHTF